MGDLFVNTSAAEYLYIDGFGVIDTTKNHLLGD